MVVLGAVLVIVALVLVVVSLVWFPGPLLWVGIAVGIVGAVMVLIDLNGRRRV